MTLLNEYLLKIASYDDDEHERAYRTIHDPNVSLHHRLRAYKDLTKMEASYDKKSKLMSGLKGALVGGGLGGILGASGTAAQAEHGLRGKAALIGGGIGATLGAGIGALRGVASAKSHNKMVERAKSRLGMSDEDIEHDMIRRAANRRAENDERRENERQRDRARKFYRDINRDRLLEKAVANGSRPAISI